MNGKTQIVAVLVGLLVIVGFGLLTYFEKVGQYVGFGAMLVGVGVMFPAKLKQIADAIVELLPFGKKS